MSKFTHFSLIFKGNGEKSYIRGQKKGRETLSPLFLRLQYYAIMKYFADLEPI